MHWFRHDRVGKCVALPVDGDPVDIGGELNYGRAIIDCSRCLQVPYYSISGEVRHVAVEDHQIKPAIQCAFQCRAPITCDDQFNVSQLRQNMLYDCDVYRVIFCKKYNFYFTFSYSKH